MDLIERCVETLHAYFELGNATRSTGTATLVSSADCPSVYDANCVMRIRAETPDEIDVLLSQVEKEYAGVSHRSFKIDPLSPAPFEARLLLDGFEATAELQLVLEGELDLVTPAIDIRPVLDASDWSSIAALLRMDHEETAARRRRDCWPPTVTAQIVEQKKRKAPEVRFFLARVDGQDCAFFSSWPGVDGVGKVEDLFTAPSFRHRGIATALIVHAVADARRRGAGAVLIGAEADDTPKAMYAALGFRPLLIYRSYLKA